MPLLDTISVHAVTVMVFASVPMHVFVPLKAYEMVKVPTVNEAGMPDIVPFEGVPVYEICEVASSLQKAIFERFKLTEGAAFTVTVARAEFAHPCEEMPSTE